VDWVILPGVGALNNLYGQLQQRGFLEVLPDLKKGGTRFLGICLGLQAFFGDGEEGGHGLGWLEGTVPRLDAPILPHIGFNAIKVTETSPGWLREFDRIPFYFVHSYRVHPTDSSYVAATTRYHEEFPSVIAAPALYGVQFHPELSGPVGDRFFQKLFASGT
jgi:imidazole glycerol phosphate synthase glutamine amidotransferase subunit